MVVLNIEGAAESSGGLSKFSLLDPTPELLVQQAGY